MSRIIVERKHSLSRNVVRVKAEELAEMLSKKYDINYRWDDDVLVFKRVGAHGNIVLDPGVVRLKLDLGFLLLAFESTIKAEIERTLDESLRS